MRRKTLQQQKRKKTESHESEVAFDQVMELDKKLEDIASYLWTREETKPLAHFTPSQRLMVVRAALITRDRVEFLKHQEKTIAKEFVQILDMIHSHLQKKEEFKPLLDKIKAHESKNSSQWSSPPNFLLQSVYDFLPTKEVVQTRRISRTYYHQGHRLAPTSLFFRNATDAIKYQQSMSSDTKWKSGVRTVVVSDLYSHSSLKILKYSDSTRDYFVLNEQEVNKTRDDLLSMLGEFVGLEHLVIRDEQSSKYDLYDHVGLKDSSLFTRLKKLRSLKIVGVAVFDQAKNALNALKQLQQLILVGSRNPPFFDGVALPNLLDLQIVHKYNSGVPNATHENSDYSNLQQFGRLQNLTLECVFVTVDFFRAIFRHLVNLQRLDLINCYVKAEDRPVLGELLLTQREWDVQWQPGTNPKDQVRSFSVRQTRLTRTIHVSDEPADKSLNTTPNRNSFRR